MKRPAIVFFSMAMSTGVSAADRNSLARFDGGTGVIPASRRVVRGRNSKGRELGAGR